MDFRCNSVYQKGETSACELTTNDDNNLQNENVYKPLNNDISTYELDSNANVTSLSTPELDSNANVTPLSTAGFFSILYFMWLNPLMKKGHKKPLEEKDIPMLGQEDRAGTLYYNFLEKLNKSKQISSPSLFWIIVSYHKNDILLSGFFALLKILTLSSGPIILNLFIKVSSRQEVFKYERCVLALGLFFAKCIESLSQRQWNFRTRRIGLQIRSLLSAMIYKKQQRLSAKLTHSSGEIMNYLTVDAYRIGEFPYWFHQAWTTILQISIALIILYNVVGLATVFSLIAIILTVAINIPLANLQHKFQKNLMTAQDKRLKAMSESLMNMKVLKLYAWEWHFRKVVENLRKEEHKWIEAFQIRKAYNTFLFWSAPVLVSAVTFLSCYFLGINLDASNVFTFVATVRLVQDPIRLIPMVIGVVIQAKVAFTRISEFLEVPELQNVKMRKDVLNFQNSIVIEVGNFSWDENLSIPTLRNVNLEVKEGEKFAICGEVGSGKSSLLAAILGEISKTHGKINVRGNIAFVSQSAWIQSATVQENILFGSSMDEKRYHETLERCSLVKDLEVLPFGDETIIGERGINLSGGQKQRVQLARALYQNADIYLLDDPFSAVDAHTTRSLFSMNSDSDKNNFDGCMTIKNIQVRIRNAEVVFGMGTNFIVAGINFLRPSKLFMSESLSSLDLEIKFVVQDYVMGALANKTVLLVTHQVGLLQAFDSILLMSEGEIFRASSFQELFASCEEFQKLVHAHKKTVDVDQPNKIIPHNKKIHDTTIEGNESVSVKQQSTNDVSDQLIKEEERERGNTGLKPYMQYLSQNKGYIYFLLMSTAQILFISGQILQNAWMAANLENSNVSTLKLILVYIAIGFVTIIFLFMRTSLTVVLGLETSKSLFTQLLNSLFRAPTCFYDSTPLGRILSRVSSDLNLMDLDVPLSFMWAVGATMNAYANLGVLSVVTWQVLFVTVPMIILAIRLQIYYLASSKELMRIDGTTKSFMASHLSESIAGATNIRAFHEEDRFFAKNLELIDRNANPSLHNFASTEWFILRIETMTAVILASSALVIALLPPGTFSPGFIGMTLSYGLSLNTTFAFSIQNQCNLANLIISVERLNQYMNIKSEAPEIIEEDRPAPDWPAIGTVELHDLEIRYRPNMPLVLHGITCTFQGGHKIGIVGRTGSGKTTLISALFRLVEPAGGKIIIDGLDIAQIGLHDLRSRLGIIPQDPAMFNGSVRNNLDPLGQFSDIQIWEVLDKCQIREVVQCKEQGLDSLVMEEGSNWSMGQRQLFCLGRTLLRRSQILVLDEATASIDNATDAILQKTIRTEFADCTVITVAHRIPTVMDCTMILSISDGKLVEYDKPSKLMNTEGSLFRDLVKEYWSHSSNENI